MVTLELQNRLAEWAEQDRADYVAHCDDLPLLSLHNDDDLSRALAKIDQLVDAPALSVGSQRYLEALSDLVSVYEDRTVHFPRATGIDILRHLMEERGLQQKDLVGVLGTKSIVSELLNGKRCLNLAQMMRLSDYFGIPVSVFVDAPTVNAG